MDAAFRVLIVCRANVCRSPLAESLMAQALDRAGLSSTVLVESAGTHAGVGEAACPQAMHWSPAAGFGRGSRGVTAQLLGSSDLVLAADRESRAECALLDPACRPRMFTLNQAAVVADSLRGPLEDGLPIEGAPSMPIDPRERLTWLVGEMDAARTHLSARPGDSDDIADRHGPAPHSDVFVEVEGAVTRIVGLLAAVAG